MPSAAPPGSPTIPDPAALAGSDLPGYVAPTDLDESRLHQLIGLHSSKAGFYAQWRGTRRDLERALAALRSLSQALCVTAFGPAALCEGVLGAVGRLFDADWTALVLADEDLPSTLPSDFSWCREPGGGIAPERLAALAAQVRDTSTTITVAADDGGRRGVLAVPMRMDYRPVGVLLVGTPPGGGQDGIGVSILETVANQIVVAVRNAQLYEHSELLRRQAVDGWSEAERRADELARRNAQLRHARGRLARARRAELVSAERHRIARDLHDGVAQGLVGIGMHLEWCQRHLEPGSAMHGRLLSGKELARAALEQIRSAVFELSRLERPGTGLRQALRDLAVDLRPVASLRVSVRVCGQQRPLPLEVEHALFQIAQEGLWNTVRHARAERAWLELRYLDRETRLSIADDGCGDAAVLGRHLGRPGRRRAGHGLRNIAERACELGGRVEVERRRGGGVRIRVCVPVAEAAGPDFTSAGTGR